MPNTIIFWRIASTYAFCPSVFGLTGLLAYNYLAKTEKEKPTAQSA